LKASAVTSPLIAIVPTSVPIKNKTAPAVKKSVANEEIVKKQKMDLGKDDFGETANSVAIPQKLPTSNKGFFSFSQPSKDTTISKNPTKNDQKPIPITTSKTPTKSDQKLPSFSNPFAKKTSTPTPLVVDDNSKAVKDTKGKESKISKTSQQIVPEDKIVTVPTPPKEKSRLGSIFSLDYNATIKTGIKKAPIKTDTKKAPIKTNSKIAPISNVKPKK
jgi:hypothetical protein